MDNMDLHTIIDEFERSSLSELELKCKTYSVRMTRSTGQKPESPTAIAMSANPIINKDNIIDSPLVGTFYLTPSPDAPPFIKEGDVVKEGDILCIIEAMKMMNQLQAEFPCEIVKILAKQGTMVEFGQPLFEVRRI